MKSYLEWVINGFQEILPLQPEKHGFPVRMTRDEYILAAGSVKTFFKGSHSCPPLPTPVVVIPTERSEWRDFIENDNGHIHEDLYAV